MERLLIRHEQKKVFDEIARREFDLWLLDHVRDIWRSRTARFEEKPLVELLQKVVLEAREVGMETSAEVVDYVHLAMLLGPGFLDDSRTPWAGSVFRREGLLGEQKLRVAMQIVRACELETVGLEWGSS